MNAHNHSFQGGFVVFISSLELRRATTMQNTLVALLTIRAMKSFLSPGG